MEIKGIKYIGPITDGSGYAEAGRNYIFSLLSQGISITVDPVFWDTTPPNLDLREAQVLMALINKEIEYNIVIQHVVPRNLTHPPDEWVKRTGRKSLLEEDKFNILNTVWETDRLFYEWVELINHTVNAVMVPCQWNKDVFEKSGVRVPVIKVPHAIDPRKYIAPAYPELYHYEARDKYTFYTIGQWASPCKTCGMESRKRIEDVIRVFKALFSGVPHVELILKTYGSDNRPSEQERVEKWIKNLLSRINVDPCRNIIYEGNVLSANDLRVLHQRGDCFILLSSGEGFCLPAFEAACVGNATIMPGYGGQMEFLEGSPLLTKFTKEPVLGFYPAVWYRGDMTWIRADLGDAMEKMKKVYYNPDYGRKVGAEVQGKIFQNFTREKIGKQLVDKIKEL